jgi:hypothetical protein
VLWQVQLLVLWQVQLLVLWRVQLLVLLLSMSAVLGRLLVCFRSCC